MDDKCAACGMCAAGGKKCECGMPLNEKTECSCDSKKCIYCCSCPEECKCECRQKASKEE